MSQEVSEDHHCISTQTNYILCWYQYLRSGPIHISISLYQTKTLYHHHTWYQNVLTILLSKNSGNIQRALNVQDNNGPIKFQTALCVPDPPSYVNHNRPLLGNIDMHVLNLSTVAI